MSRAEDGIRPGDVTVELVVPAPDGCWQAVCHRDGCHRPPMLIRRDILDADADRVLHLNRHILDELEPKIGRRP